MCVDVGVDMAVGVGMGMGVGVGVCRAILQCGIVCKNVALFYECVLCLCPCVLMS